MKKIGITGSLASGKTTASKILSKNKGPLFSADIIVKKIYKNVKLTKKISKVLGVPKSKNFKTEIKKKVLQNRKLLRKLENVIHPIVRKEMTLFIKKNDNKKFIFLEIPLLIESKLTRYFDIIIFIKSSKKLRLKRYIKKFDKGVRLFEILDKEQIKDSKKLKYCDHIVVNNKSLPVLKRKLSNILKLYE